MRRHMHFCICSFQNKKNSCCIMEQEMPRNKIHPPPLQHLVQDMPAVGASLM